jgi:hypothetical protein
MPDPADPTTESGPTGGARPALPWIVAGVTSLIAVVAVVALVIGGGGDDGDKVVTADLAGAASTTAGPNDEGDDADKDVKELTDETTVLTPSSIEGSDTTPKPPTTHPPATTATTGGTTTSSTTSTSTSTSTSSTSSTSSSTTTSSTTTTTTPPVLDFTLPPVYGSSSLTAGFVPDPFTVGVTGGGPVSAAYLGTGCGGYASSAPSFSVNYTKGAFPLLRFYFVGSGDSTMIINTPGGSWVCRDDSFGTLHPTLDFNSPASGRYDVWIGSYNPGGAVPGTLYVTENSGNHP